ncbi:MAG TPA: carboxypeptidase regulatory-like domain-containing protein, partial [Homoserinimonas sp.]|nr:carboxypeptidase regulatory-like domain-containing protein [Homoserinimonas sp.]
MGILAAIAVGSWPALLHAQSVLHGVVRDAESSMPVADARISVLDSMGRVPVTVASDARGRFAARLPSAGLYTVVVARIGYFPDTLQSVRVILERRLDVALRAGAVVLPPIEVVSRPVAGELASPVLHRTRSRLKLVPAAAGIEDPVRALGLEPGVALANPYSARLTVRGSAPSELGFFVDGFPILNPAQLGGTFSAIPASAVSGVTLWGTAAPFRLSGSSGGVVDVSTTPALGRGFEADAGLNVLASDAALRFSSDDRAAIATAARYSWFPATLEDRSERDEFSLSDYLLSVSVAPTRRARAFGMAFRSAESRGDVDFGTGTQRRVGNYHRWGRTLGAGFELSLSDRSSVSARAWDARARAGGERLELASLEAVDSSTMRDQGALIEATSVTGKVQWTIGAKVANLSASTDARFTTFLGELDAGALRTGSTRTVTSVHIASGWQLGAGTLLDAGAAAVFDGGTVGLEPTLAAQVQLSPAVQVFGSASSRTQHLFQLTDPRSRPWASFSVVDVWAVAGDGADVGNHPARTTEFTTGA